MTLYFITGNENKFAEVKAFLGEVEHLNIELPEIQSLDSKEIIKAKLQEALKHKQGEFIVEDTSLCIESLNGLPGPLIKWFLKTMGREGIAKISLNSCAEAKTIIGYAKNKEDINFFEGCVKGKIVSPEHESNFGWDPIFQPEGYSKTFAEMTKEEKTAISMRGKALKKLKEFLENEYKKRKNY